MKLGMMLDIHDDMTFKVIRGQGQGQEMTSVPYRDYFKFYFALYHVACSVILFCITFLVSVCILFLFFTSSF